MQARYVKTESGREEIRTRGRGLPRTTRNLLLMIDGVRNSGDLLAQLQGVSAADLEQLEADGLIEPVAGLAASSINEVDLALSSMPGVLGDAGPPLGSAVARKADAAPLADRAGVRAGGELRADDRELRAVIGALTYQQLYKVVSDQARERLGMIRGYKLTLEIERAGDIDTLRELALQFAMTVREVRGPVVAGELRREFERAA